MSNEIESNVEVTETTATEVETTETVAETKKEVKPERIVTMKDGTQENFGVRGNVLTSADVDTGIISFKTIEGDRVEFDTNAIVEVGSVISTLPAFLKQVVLYGILAKVKSALAPVKENYAVAITNQLEAIAKGEFSTRQSGNGSEVNTGLSDLEKAYALVKANRDPNLATWANVDDQATIDAVKAHFATLSTGDKAKLRNHPLVKLELANIAIAKGNVADL